MNIFSGRDRAKEKKIEEVLLQNYDSYYRLAYSYVQNEADAGDIVQNGAYRAINMLSPEDKAVVQLRFFEDKKLEDIAKILGENVSTVKSRLYRSMKKLRLELEES